MGFVHEPTPEMGEWRVETRRESFYLQGGEVYAYGDSPDVQVEFLLEDIPKIRAALDQAENEAPR